MHKITFFPIGNADTSLIELENGKVVLVDYANTRCADDPDDKRIDLEKELNDRVTKDSFDVVCISHLDEDHYKGSTKYFFLEHSADYQSEGRKKINELWVSAAAILEENFDEDCWEAEILHKEAVFRFKKGKGIKVFSRPKGLRDWCKKNGINLDDRRNIIVDAGKTVDTLKLETDGVEIFALSPFISHIDGAEIDRNRSAITMQVTFDNDRETKIIFGSDINWDVWRDIVKVTRKKGNGHRLEWDIFNISHHCSYTALSDVKGEDKTKPNDEVKWMYEEQGSDSCFVVSPSKPTPAKGSDEDQDNNPPHRQAANYYKDVVKDHHPNNITDHFKVTMEHPTTGKPKPMTFLVTEDSGLELEKAIASTAGVIGSIPPPRAGFR